MSDTDTAAQQKASGRTPEEKEVMRALMWALYRHGTPGAADDRPKFKDVRADYRKAARKIVRSLEKRGVRLTLAAKPGDEG